MRIPHRLSSNRGAVALLTMILTIFVLVPCMFAIRNLSILTTAHSRMTESAQIAAYAGASVGRAGPEGSVVIDQAGAGAQAQAVIDGTLQGFVFSGRSGLREFSVEAINISANPEQARTLDPNCQTASLPDGQRYCWRDGFGGPHWTSGVVVRIKQDVTLAPLASAVTLTSTGYADYTFQVQPR